MKGKSAVYIILSYKVYNYRVLLLNKSVVTWKGGTGIWIFPPWCVSTWIVLLGVGGATRIFP